MSIKLIHEELIERGYSVIPVNSNKEPLAPQYKDCYDRRCPELGKLFEDRVVKKKQAGIALLGRINPYFPVRMLVIIDVDDPRKFPPEARELLKDTWHWLTGPRCPKDGDKHDIVCSPVACRHGDHDFDLNEAVRGEAYAVLAPAEAEELIEAGIAKLAGGAVEIRIRGYQLIPPSIHPSGITYEWVASPWAGGAFSHPKELTLEEFKRLIDVLGGAAGAQPPPKEVEAERCRTFRELSDEDVAKIVEIIKPWYVKDHRNHILVALLGILRRACYSGESIAKFYNALESWAVSVYDDVNKKKDDYILRGVLEGRDWRLYGWPGLRNELMQVAQKTGRSAEDVKEVVRQLKRIILKSEVKMRLCLEREVGESGAVCVKYLRAKITPRGMLVEAVYKKKKKIKIRKVALLPANMAVVRDPYYAEDYYVAYADGGMIAAAPVSEWDDFLNAVRQRPPYSIVAESKIVDEIKQMLPYVVDVVSSGLTDGSIVDPAGVLDKNDYGVEPLVNAYRWIINSYSVRNAKLAWFNVIAVFAKLFTPLIRVRKKNFIDYIIYNVGRGGEGKSTLARYVLTPLLGGEDALEAYNIRVDGAVRTEPQLRNLLALNRLPLILDEQTKKALVSNSGILLSAAVGLGMTGVQAAKHGHGIAVKFKNLRGVVVFTNVSFSTFVRAAASESSDYALLRRFIELAWDFEPINPDAFKSMPEIKPAYGYAVRLWRKYGNELMQAADLLELIEMLADVLAKEHAGDAAVAEMSEYTKQVAAELRELKTLERQSLRDEDSIVDRAYQFVADDLKVSQLSAIKVLRYIFENASRAGIAFTTPKSADLRALADDVYDVVAKIKSMYTTASSQLQDRLSEDAAVVINILTRLAEEKRVAVVVLAKTPLVPGAPRTLAGIQKNVYVVGGVKRYGYAMPLAKFTNMFLDSERAEEDAQDEIGE